MRKANLINICLAIFLAFDYLPVFSQTLTAMPGTSMVANSNGYYEYLPANYNSGTSNYPLIIFCHGIGELGDGTASQLPRIVNTGLPALLNQGQFPLSFITNGQSFSFIIISPQFISWPAPGDIDGIIDYCMNHYRADKNRVYLTGLSMGGGITWEYPGNNISFANRLAAIVPIAGASWPEPTRAYIIAAANLPVWATHNDGDPTVPVTYTENYVQEINTAPSPPAVPAKATIFHSNSHDAWTQTYNPAFTENGMNIYQWMLQFQRSIGVVLPVSVTDYKAFLPVPGQIAITWTTTAENSNDHFTVEKSPDGIDFNSLEVVRGMNRAYTYLVKDLQPFAGENYYRLTQTDINGKTVYFKTLNVKMDGLQGHFTIDPNPAREVLNMSLYTEEKGLITASVVNMQGMLIKQWVINKQNTLLEQSFSIGDLAPGNYMFMLKGFSFHQTQKFIKN